MKLISGRTWRWFVLLFLTISTWQDAAAAPPAWSNAHGQFVTAVAWREGRGFVATEDRGLWMIDSDGGTWQSLKLASATSPVSALAVDSKNRLWVGHVYQGVSVFDGSQWENYDAPSGPLGHHVWRIATSPLDGDVWLATDLGLCRYSMKRDTWWYITRAQGLPSDQIDSLAFDSDGTLYVGTQCDGLAIAGPADDYAAWRVVTGPSRLPVTATGSGLPSNLINDIVVTNGQSTGVFVATNGGLAISRDHGATWSFQRGADFANKVRNRTGGAPPDWDVEATATAMLAEDDVMALAGDSAGHLWVGYRRMGFELFDAKTLERLSHAPEQATAKVDCVKCIVPTTPDVMWIGTCGQGLAICPTGQPAGAPPVPSPTAAPAALPSAVSIKPNRGDELSRQLSDAKPQPLTAVFLGDDWVTRGDGAGRYGRQKVMFPFYGMGGWADGYSVEVSVGPHQTNGGPYYYFADLKSEDERVLYLPNSFRRSQGEWNDGSFDSKAYPVTFEGPDLWLNVDLPPGVHRLTLSFINFDGHAKKNRWRDFTIEVKAAMAQAEDADFAPALAKARVCDFYQPVYKQFLLAGGKRYHVKIGRNYSYVTKLSGVFLDRMAGPAPKDIDSLPQPLLDPDHWGPPAAPPRQAPADESAPIRQARDLWDQLDARYEDAATTPLQLPLRLQAYRLAADNNADPALLANWRWKLALWDDAARLEFCQQMDAGYDRTIAGNPQAAKSDRVKMVDQYAATHR
jgi:hypothetical protein